MGEIVYWIAAHTVLISQLARQDSMTKPPQIESSLRDNRTWGNGMKLCQGRSGWELGKGSSPAGAVGPRTSSQAASVQGVFEHCSQTQGFIFCVVLYRVRSWALWSLWDILWFYDQSQATTLQTDPAGLLESLSHIPGDVHTMQAKSCAVLYVESLLNHLCAPRYRETWHQKRIFP